jgi:hypothetical protein
MLAVKVAPDPSDEPEPEPEVEVEALSDYSKMTKGQLLGIANSDYDLGIPMGFAKARIITAIVAHEAKVPESAPEEAPEDDLDGWIDYCRRRLDIIKSDTRARPWALARWDSKVLVPPKSITTLAQAHALSKYLDRVEAEFGMQFVTGQPSPAPRKGKR